MDEDLWFEAANVSCLKNGYEVVRDLNLKLKNNENIVLLGPNGSGKSSLIELINRNIYPVLNVNTVFKIFNKELINIWELRKRISTVNNDIKNRINPNIKVFDLIISGIYGSYCIISNKNEQDYYLVENLLQKIGLTNLSQRKFSFLSEGEKQIVMIARALINNPQILILDEPITNLDLKSKYFVVDQIDELARLNTTIISTTHDISMVTEIYDRIILLKERLIFADGKQTEVLNSKNISKLFDINIDIIENKGNWNIYRRVKE